MRGLHRLRVLGFATGSPRGLLTRPLFVPNPPREGFRRDGRRKQIEKEKEREHEKEKEREREQEQEQEREREEAAAAAARETLRATAALWRAVPSSLRARLLPRAYENIEEEGEKTTTTLPSKIRNSKKQKKWNCEGVVEPSTHRLTPSFALRRGVRYFTGVHAQRWGECLHREGATGGSFLVPAYRCPLCFAKKNIQRGGNETPWESPEAMTNHLSWRHPHEGFAPQEFAAFNAHVVRRLVARLWGEGGAPPRQTKRNPSKLHETNHQGGDKEALDVATEVGVISPHSTGFSSSISPPSPPPFQLLLLVDVANMELNSSPAVLELLESPEAKRFFSSMPIAFGMIHEIFIPHTAKTPHGFFRLAQLHPWSEMFTYYAVSRLESGDMEISSLIGALRIETDAHARRRGKIAATASLEESRSRAVSPRLPPMVILTMDKHLKTSLIEHYGDGGGDERLFNTTVDASEFESVNGAIPRLQHQSEVRLYVPRALSAFQIMRTLRLLQKGMSV